MTLISKKVKHAHVFPLIILTLCMSICNVLKAQTNVGYEAYDYLKVKDYNRALVEFLKMYKKDKKNVEINTKVGFCYLNVNDDKTKGIPYFEYAYKNGDSEPEILLYLGLSYMYAYRFDSATKYFNDYKLKTKSKEQAQVNHLIENCENAKQLIKNPVNVTFRNLGRNINSPYPDFNPFVTKDQSTLYFTSSRITNKKKIASSQGFYTSDIYFSKIKNGEWTAAKDIGNLNTEEDEECVYISPDGKNMLLCVDNDVVVGDLFMSSVAKDNKFSAATPFNEPVNTGSVELQGCISNNKDMIIVSSERSGGLGESDLYMIKKLPNGNWALPVNLGPAVNTPYKEAFPRYDEANKILYFSSQGHNSMGGFDIFKSKFNEQTKSFEETINMGYPINTPEDNMQFSLAGNKRDGYIAAYRKEGLGDLDIYSLIFNDIEIKISVIKGVVSVKDSLNKKIDAKVTIINKKTNKEVEAKNASPRTGKYVFAVEPGSYLLTVSSPDYKDYTEEIVIYDKSDADNVFEIVRNIILNKIETSTQPAPQN